MENYAGFGIVERGASLERRPGPHHTVALLRPHTDLIPRPRGSPVKESGHGRVEHVTSASTGRGGEPDLQKAPDGVGPSRLGKE
jgi:hypothetical protein